MVSQALQTESIIGFLYFKKIFKKLYVFVIIYLRLIE